MNPRDPLAPNTKRYRPGEWTAPVSSGGPSPLLLALWAVLIALVLAVIFADAWAPLFLEWFYQ